MPNRNCDDKRLVDVSYFGCSGCGTIVTVLRSDFCPDGVSFPKCECKKPIVLPSHLWVYLASDEVEPAIAVSGMVRGSAGKKKGCGK